MELLSESGAESLDQNFRAALAKASKGMSPLDLGLAYMDWASHLSISPGRRLLLAQSLINKLRALGVFGIASLLNKDAEGPASTTERRMSGEAWQKWPFKVLAQAHQTSKDWWEEAILGVDGVREDHEIVVHAVAEHILDLLSPANFPLTNPEVLQATRQEKGKNLFRGLKLFLKDQFNDVANKGLAENREFKVGENLGITPGKVIFQNELIELIQYKPVNAKVNAEPVLIFPPWIMKYYILDLSPRNSMVKYLTEQGKTVFIVSWRNPKAEDRDISFDDYRTLGFMGAIDAVSGICPKRKINAVGYCLGGTMLLIAAAAMARENDDRLGSISLFAAQVDFSEAGDILRFISPSQISFLEKVMWKQGYLGIENMGGAFSALQASDLIYAGAVNRYLLGNESKPSDLMSWNADGTRMPYKMHSQYLTALYLENQLGRNKFEVDGRPIAVSDIRVPLFVLGTETDHVAPWKSVYKVHDFTHEELTFLLTSGGHNAGVVSGPEHPRRRYRVHTRKPGDNYVDPGRWMEDNEPVQGSWWPYWDKWLNDHSSKVQVKPPSMGASRKGYKVLRDAPGEYVMG
ncbi:MAG: poly-beta-hydroxybutyrate polymerase [Gammaproteobacteria bacterium]|nr:MAG: poly-beta-hydroxybutyrate polymerase [Gammaproteobacteria bacterium]